MRKPLDVEKYHTDARQHDDLIKSVAREFITHLVNESEAGRTPDSETGRIAQEAAADYDTVADEINAPEDPDNLDQVRHQSEPTKRAALNSLARDISRSRSYDDDSLSEMSGDELLDLLVAELQARRQRK